MGLNYHLLSFAFMLSLGSLRTISAAVQSVPEAAYIPIMSDTDLSDLYGDLGLSDSQITTIQDQFDQISVDEMLARACYVAQQALGIEQVDTSPLNQTVVEENWSQECIATPYCIFQPSTPEHVSQALNIIKSFGVKFAVRSGGHSPNPGWSSVNEEGVLIDMQRMNTVTLSSDRQFASVGPGGRWGDVVNALDAQQATVVGGRVPVVGVAGLILSGGIHHLLAEYGTAADNVHNFQIVLADGTITNANAEQNNDLFWALKGGGPNFGIVTRFDLYNIPVREIWYEIRIYAVDQVSDVFDAHIKWQQGGASDVKSAASLLIGLDTVTVVLQYSAPVDRPQAFDPFYELEPLQFAVPSTIGTFASLTAFLASIAVTEPMRHDYRAVSSRIDGNLYKEVYHEWREMALAARETTGANQTFIIQHVSRNVARQGRLKGGNPMGIPEEDHIWWTTLVDWRNSQDDDVVRAVAIQTTQNWVNRGRKSGLHLPYIFMNDAARDQNPLSSYGPENLQKLKDIALKYDQTGLFQSQQNGGFLLSRA